MVINIFAFKGLLTVYYIVSVGTDKKYVVFSLHFTLEANVSHHIFIIMFIVYVNLKSKFFFMYCIICI